MFSETMPMAFLSLSFLSLGRFLSWIYRLGKTNQPSIVTLSTGYHRPHPRTSAHALPFTLSNRYHATHGAANLCASAFGLIPQRRLDLFDIG